MCNLPSAASSKLTRGGRPREGSRSRRWPSQCYWFVNVGIKTEIGCCGKNRDRVDGQMFCQKLAPLRGCLPYPLNLYARCDVGKGGEGGRGGRNLVAVALPLFFVWKFGNCTPKVSLARRTVSYFGCLESSLAYSQGGMFYPVYPFPAFRCSLLARRDQSVRTVLRYTAGPTKKQSESAPMKVRRTIPAAVHLVSLKAAWISVYRHWPRFSETTSFVVQRPGQVSGGYINYFNNKSYHDLCNYQRDQSDRVSFEVEHAI